MATRSSAGPARRLRDDASVREHRDRAADAGPGLRNIANRDQGAALLLYPAQNKRILVMGGGNEGSKTVTNMADVIDLRAAHPSFVPAANMPVAASQFVATNLPRRHGLRGRVGPRGVPDPGAVGRSLQPRHQHRRQAAVPTVSAATSRSPS